MTAIKAGLVDLSSEYLDNHIINGGLHFWQRVGGSALAFSGTTLPVNYSADRFAAAANGSSTKAFTVQRSTDVPTFAQANAVLPYSYAITCATGNTLATDDVYLPLIYRIEGYDYARLHGRMVTLSFWVKSNKPGIYAAALNGAGYTRSYVTSFQVLAAGVWEKKKISVTLENSGAYLFDTGLGLELTLAAVGGTNSLSSVSNTWKTTASGDGYYDSTSTSLFDTTGNYMNIAGIQLNLGPVAAPFLLAAGTAASELRLCQRYFQFAGQWWVNYSGTSDFVGKFITEMRTGPSSIAVLTPTVGYNILGIGAGTCTYSSVVGASTTGGIIRCTSFSGSITNSLLAVTSDSIGWNAEL